MNLTYKNLAVLIIIGLMMFMLFRVFKQPGNSVSIGYSDFLSMVESESVIQVTIKGDNISGLSAHGPFGTFAPKDYSEMTAQKIDEEVRDIIIGAYKKAAQLIKNNEDTLHRMANALLEKETLNSGEIDVLMAGVKKSIPEKIGDGRF